MCASNKPQRALSLKQAQNCENALGKVCRCRCGGALHGGKRGGENIPDRDFFSSLPADDPHHLKPKKQQEPRPVQMPLPANVKPVQINLEGPLEELQPLADSFVHALEAYGIPVVVNHIDRK